VLSQEKLRDAAVNFDTHQILQWYSAVCLPEHGFLLKLFLKYSNLCEKTCLNVTDRQTDRQTYCGITPLCVHRAVKTLHELVIRLITRRTAAAVSGHLNIFRQ